MDELNVKPNMQVFITLMSVMTRHNNNKLALQVYQKMQQCNLRGDNYIYSKLIKSLIEGNMIEDACSICQDSFANKICLDTET